MGATCSAAGTPAEQHPGAKEALNAFKSRVDNYPLGTFPENTMQTVELALSKIRADKRRPETCVDLEFDNKGLSEKGATAMAEVLRRNCHVRKLAITRDDVGEEGAAELGKGIRFNTELVELDLSSNSIGNKGVSTLLKHLNDNDTLSVLRLCNVNMDDKASLIISQSMLARGNLNCVDVSNNKLGIKGVSCLAKTLRANHSMVTLNVAGNPGSKPEFQAEIDAVLERNRAVTDIVYNVIFERATSFEEVQKHRLASQPSAEGNSLSATGGAAGASGGSSADGGMGDRNCTPIDGTIAGRCFSFGSAEMRGRRQQMQDVIMMKVNFRGSSNEHLFGVFDGHGGLECAKFVGANFPTVMHELMTEKGVPTAADHDQDAVKECMRLTFKRLNDWIVEFEIPSGTCAVVSFFKGTTVYTACVGDSQSVLVREGPAGNGAPGEGAPTAQRLNKVFKPTDPEEKDRIERLKGFVTDNGRVCGVLAVSRALGDVPYQPYISPEPHIGLLTLKDDDRGLILACDGVWDVFTNQEACDELRHIRNPVRGAHELMKRAYDKGSTDNISTISITFGKPAGT